MTEQEYKSFTEFINKILYEVMTLDDYENIVRRLGGIKKGNRYNTICHNIEGGKFNLQFHEESRVFTCFSECQCSYSLLSLVKRRFKLLNKTDSTILAMKWICEQIGVKFDFTSTTERDTSNLYDFSYLKKYTKIGRQAQELKVYDKSILNYFENKYHMSWVEDNITIETMEKYSIKWNSYHNSIIIPCYSRQGELIGIRERFINPSNEFKYLPLTLLNGTSFKFNTSQILFGLNHNQYAIMQKKKVILFEAEKSVLQCESYFPTFNYSLAMFGSNLSKENAKQILRLGIDEIIISLDADYHSVFDENGEFTKEFKKFKEKTYKIGDMFKSFCKVTSTIMYYDFIYKQSSTDKGSDYFKELYRNREELY